MYENSRTGDDGSTRRRRVDLALMIVGGLAVGAGIACLPEASLAPVSWALIPLGLVAVAIGFALYQRRPPRQHPPRDARPGVDRAPIISHYDGGFAGDGGGGGGD